MPKRTTPSKSEGQPQNRQGNRRGKRQLHPAMLPFQYKPGQSGNPGGRPRSKPLTDILEHLLAQEMPGSKNHRTYGQALMEEVVKRAIKKSDVLAKEIIDRIEGKLSPETKAEKAATSGYEVLILDMPRPERPIPPQLPRAVFNSDGTVSVAPPTLSQSANQREPHGKKL